MQVILILEKIKFKRLIAKWSNKKSQMKSLKLHMIGKLQSNKAKDAVKLFDYIHSLDNQKLADLHLENISLH